MVIHTNNAELRYLMENKDAKMIFIRLMLLLQEFDFEVKDKWCSENQVADHLSRLEGKENDDLEIDIYLLFPGWTCISW